MKTWICETCPAVATTKLERAGWAATGRSQKQAGELAHFCPACYADFTSTGRMYRWWLQQTKVGRAHQA